MSPDNVNIEEWQSRTALLLGNKLLSRLAELNVLVVGVGGVGAYAAEMLVRAGVGHMTIVDGDVVATSNLNRQLIALTDTIGLRKTEVLARRMMAINPELKLQCIDRYLNPEDIAEIIDRGSFSYVVDAIDSVAPKVALIAHCLRSKVRIVSSMGAGGRIDPTRVQYADISDTYNDGLAKAVRSRLKAMGISRGLTTVWSSEPPATNSLMLTDELRHKRSSFGTVSYLPCVFGCMLAAHIINKEKRKAESD